MVAEFMVLSLLVFYGLAGKVNRMKLSKSNPFLIDKTAAKASLIVSARMSSGIEGIRQPFERANKTVGITDTRTFTEHWQQRCSVIKHVTR
jgi:hypothetical protein